MNCKICDSIRMTQIGWIVTEGFLCEACYHFHDKDGSIRKVKYAVPLSKNQLFKSDLRFDKKKRVKVFKQTTILRKAVHG